MNINNYDKPVLTYEQQLNKLKEEYSVIIDMDDQLAINFLKKLSYYDLKDKYNFFLKDTENLSFSYLIKFYYFDNKIQNIFLEQCILIEHLFKEALAHFISIKFGVHQDKYLNPDNYNGKDKNSKLKKLSKNLKTNNDPTHFYRDNYNHIPPWILFRNSSFYDCIEIFKCCKKNIKNEVSNAILSNEILINNNIKYNFIINSLNIMRLYRNRITHNLNFADYNYRITKKNNDKINNNKINKDNLKCFINNDEIFNDFNNDKNYCCLVNLFFSIYFLLDNLFLQKTFIKQLYYLLKTSDKNLITDYIKLSNLPENIFYNLETIYNNIQNKESLFYIENSENIN